MPEISTPNLLDQNTHSTKCIPGVYAEMCFQSPKKAKLLILLILKKSHHVESYIHTWQKMFFYLVHFKIIWSLHMLLSISQ